MNTHPDPTGFRTVLAFYERTGPTCRGERPGAEALMRYAYASDPTQGDRLLRYAHAILEAFPAENDERPRRALLHWRHLFHRYTTELKREIAVWYAADRRTHLSLTALLWHVADRVYLRGEGYQLMDFDEAKGKTFLRFGLLELGKVLCREVEAELATDEHGQTRIKEGAQPIHPCPSVTSVAPLTHVTTHR